MTIENLRHSLLLLIEDLDRPSFKYIVNQIEEVSAQEKKKYEADSLRILSEDTDKLADLQRRVLASKVKFDCYQAILYALFNKDNLIKNVESLTKREKNNAGN